MWTQFLRPKVIGRIEFSAKFVLSSNSGYCRKHVSFVHCPRVYWQDLASSPPGKAPARAASIAVLIFSNNVGENQNCDRGGTSWSFARRAARQVLPIYPRTMDETHMFSAVPGVRAEYELGGELDATNYFGS